MPADLANKSDRTGIAQFARHTHPIIHLGVLYTTFTSLVSNTPSVLLQLLPATVAVQIIYASTCLGNAGPKKKTKSAAKGKPEVVSNVLAASLSLSLAALIGTPAIFLIIILLGAPITADLPHTALCAAHLSLLAGFPLIYSYHVQGHKWREIVSLQLPMDEVYGGALGACLGAWAGAIPIPLDWDRDWQRWPITIIVGMYAGYALGRLGGFALVGKVARFD